MTALSFNMSKLLENIKSHLKSDAMPRPPRPVVNDQPPENQGEPANSSDIEEEIIIEPEDDAKGKTKGKKHKKTFFNSKKCDDEEVLGNSGNDAEGNTSSVNVQATGNVYNIVNCKDISLGNKYYFGPVSTSPKDKSDKENKHNNQEDIKKDNLIKLLMEATIKPDHDFIDYVAKNLGKNWHSFFRSLGFTQGRIETAEINAAGYDISEARYKLLLSWVDNKDDSSLGRLATLLWEEGERDIVKQLSTMYKKMQK